MNYKILLSIIFFCLSRQVNAHDIHTDTLQHKDKKTNNHEHHKNEIGVANSPVFFIKEKVFSYGLHIHYIRNIKKSKFGLGAGFERIFDKHGHNIFGLVASYRPIEKLRLNISPGITFEDENPSKPNFALHIETAYKFEIENIHLGPVFEFAYHPEDFHFSLGLHIGFGF